MPVAVIGADLKKRFFEHTTAVGKIIHVQGRPFEVIGAAKPKGSVFGQSQDSFVMIPVETYFKMFGARQRHGVRRAGDRTTRTCSRRRTRFACCCARSGT